MSFIELLICWIVTAGIIYVSGFTSLYFYSYTCKLLDSILHRKGRKSKRKSDGDSDFD